MNPTPTKQSVSLRTKIYENSLSLSFLLLFIIFLFGQCYTGWIENNKFLEDKGSPALDLMGYLHTGHFIQATFENWESEFLQMALFIIFSIWLRQRGSSESKSIDEKEEVDNEPKASANAPWPVRKGGIYLAIYKHSLSIAFLLLFLFSFIAHLFGSLSDYNTEQLLENKATVTITEFTGMSKFWFESFQNWQSEFLSVAAIVYLTVYLRQKGSAQSKPVDTPNHENE
ncbi:MAG: DUF6766 family protein [Chitinophagaceae bacterium]